MVEVFPSGLYEQVGSTGTDVPLLGEEFDLGEQPGAEYSLG